MVVKFYYEEVLNRAERSIGKLQEHMEKAMKLVQKEHYFSFYKHLPVCDMIIGLDFLKEIQVHYGMNLEQKSSLKSFKCWHIHV